MKIKITNIYDNIKCDNQFTQDWGFGCIIDHPNTRIIFDTGAKPEILERNLKAAQIDPSSIDTIIISHKHWDHKGGALWLVEKNPNVKIYMPKTWSNGLEKALSLYTKDVHSITKHFPISDVVHLVVSKNLWITELVLAIKTSNGVIIVTGCSHTGIHRIAQNVQFVMQEKIYALFGGFHLFRSSIKNIHKILDSLKKTHLKIVAPCHCTGEEALKILKKEFAENFFVNGVGAQYIFDT
jgi:7,8-dihydropterin-6-yl-methyl-4-(beta-D-ribofuranosyl)aminobenzene 5'-phosphate synthase